MVKIRLRRVGAKKQPHYRVVVTDSSSPRDGRFIETIGNYNPRTDPPTVEIDAERAIYWLSVGAQPSAAVQRMLDKLGIMSQVAAIRKGELSPEELAEQIRPAKVEPEPPAVEEALEEEGLEEEVDLGEIEEEEEEEEEELEPEAELVDEDDWSESDEDEDTEFESDYDLDAEDEDEEDDEDLDEE